MNAPSDWFRDESTLLAELQRTRSGERAPSGLPGYEIVRELKRGGQGVVYEATQKSTRRRVAVKVLLDAAYYSSGGRRRFEREVDLAAGLRHPNVVRVYDSGVTGEARAFLVMEYVEGVCIDDFAASVRRDPRRILETFAQVCDGVQHAHTRGVIHRDLKPGNVRVDAEGVPRVLDFGLAKLHDASRAHDSSPAHDVRTLTTTGQFLGSLAWASPEQARGEHDRVDTRSDVYSLGVMLYQLLTGAFPYEVSGPLHEALNAIVSAPARSARRARPDLDVQLDVILATALAKEPERRYQSAGDLADDIRHHLCGEPIRAQRESTWRGLQRAVHRYRAVSIAGVAAFALVSGASVVAVAQARSASREREEARAQAGRAQATVEFLRNLLASANPSSGGKGLDTRVIDVIDRASGAIDTEYAGNPETLGSLHELLGELYTKLDRLDDADTHLVRSREVYATMAVGSAREESLLRVRASAGSLRVVQGRYDEAERELKSVIADRIARGEERTDPVMMSRSDLGMALRRMGRLKEAEETFRLALANMQHGAKERDSYLPLLNNIGNLRVDQGRNTEAEELFREHLALRESRHGASAGETIIARSNLGVLLLNLGRHEEALETLEPALEPARSALGPEHVTTLILLNNIGTSQMRLGRSEEAVRTLREVIDAHRAKGAEGDRWLVAPLGNLLGALADLKRFDEAAEAGREAFEVSTRLFGERSVDTLIAQNNYAVMLLRAGEPARAIGMLRRVVELSGPEGGVIPPGHEQHAMFLSSLGNALMQSGAHEEAEQRLLESFATLREKLGEENYQTRRTAGRLVELYTKLGRPGDAEKYAPK